MKDYRRKKQISDEEINAFKSVETEKIKTSLTKPNKKPNRFLSLAPVAMGIILIASLSFFLWPDAPDETYTFEKLSATNYWLKVTEDDFDFEFYYDFDIIKQGQRHNYDETFDYEAPFIYASDDLIDQFDIELNLFKYDAFNYYLEIIVNDEKRYLEVNYFKHHLDSMMLDELEIEDFKQDIKTLNEWLEKYPPTLIDEPINHFEAHEDVKDLDTSKAKQNYFNYIEHYYRVENTYGYDELDEVANTPYIMKRHQLMVDDRGNIIDTDFVSAYAYGDIDALSNRLKDFSFNRFFHFIPVGRNQPYPGFRIDYDFQDKGFNGWFRMQNFEQETPYIYSAIYLDHSKEDIEKTHFVTISYTLEETFNYEEHTYTQETFLYNRALIIPPKQIPVQLNGSMSPRDVFFNMAITLLDEDKNIIHEYEIDMD